VTDPPVIQELAVTTEPRDTPDDGRPSAEARVRLAGELHEQLASSRLAWDAALLRSDAALATGDAAEVQAALDDHRLLLGALEERLGAVVAGATAARDVEQSAQGDPPAEPLDPTPDQRASPRRGASALLGAAAAVLLVTGVLVSELPFEADGLIAGTEAPEVERALRPPPASEPLGVAGPPRVGRTSRVAPRGTLPTASGGAPAVPAPDDREPGGNAREVTREPAADRTVTSTDAEATDAEATDAEATDGDGPVPGAVTGPQRQHTALPRHGDMAGSLPSRDGGDGHDLPASSPAPLAELPQEPARQDPAAPAVAPAASEPTTELG
jgi:hypothetical protein